MNFAFSIFAKQHHFTFQFLNMIQRIQSIFLLLASASAFALFAVPFASSSEPVSAGIYADGVYNLYDSIGLLVVFSVAGALALISIFMFKNRKNQMMVGRLAIMTNVIGILLVMVLYFNQPAELQSVNDQKNYPGLLLPVAFLVFGILALRAIKKDENLVRSSDRLR